MSLSDCEKCWETPCVCGHEYKSMSLQKLSEITSAIRKVMRSRVGHLHQRPWQPTEQEYRKLLDIAESAEIGMDQEFSTSSDPENEDLKFIRELQCRLPEVTE